MPCRVSSVYYVVTAMEVRGRLADRSPVRRLGWQPGMRVHIEPLPGLIVVHAARDGADAIAAQGHVRLPARIRHACRLDGGDRVLVAAYPDRDLLVVYTMPTLDAMILAYATGMQDPA